MRLALPEWAFSTLEIYSSESWVEEDPDLEAACAAWRAGEGKRLALTPANADQVRRGLITLANTEDEAAEQEEDPAIRRGLRAARDGLSGAAQRVARYQGGR